MHDIVRQQLQLPGTEDVGSRDGSLQQQAGAAPQQRLLGAGAPPALELAGSGSGSSKSSGGEQVQVEVLAPEQPRS
jgi:hypothetical protein